MTLTVQNVVVALAALVSLGWLTARWLRRRRAKTGCDTCAAAVHARMKSNR